MKKATPFEGMDGQTGSIRPLGGKRGRTYSSPNFGITEVLYDDRRPAQPDETDNVVLAGLLNREMF